MNFLMKNCEPLSLNLQNSWIGFSTMKMYQLFVTVCEFLAYKRERERETVIPHTLSDHQIVPCEFFCLRIQNGIIQ
jgi:hypothetical protein